MERPVDEPDAEMEDEDEGRLLQKYDEAFARHYDDDHTWELLQEDEHGNLRFDRVIEQRAKRKRLLSAAQSARIRKGMIRYLILVLDLSRAASVQDFRPNRMAFMLKTCATFIRDFFNQNPLSQLGIIVMRDGVAEKLTELSGSPKAQIKSLTESKLGASGDASLQNALDLSLLTLKSIPPYGHREVSGVLRRGSQKARDGERHDTGIPPGRVSVVGVAAEVYVCRRMAEETGGSYGVALGESHLEELMLSHAPPPPTVGLGAVAKLVLMGFPQKSGEDKLVQVHVGANNMVAPGCFTCPRCKAKVGELPCSCHVCSLTLISSPHLARSYHHLFPVAPFEELAGEVLLEQASSTRRSTGHERQSCGEAGPATERGASGSTLACFGCLRNLSRAVEAAEGLLGSQLLNARAATRSAVPMVLRCQACRQAFCYDCDAYVHESLHNCPGCEARFSAA